jgi:hypothetical protein
MRFIIKLSALMSLVLAVLSGAALFWVSQQVQEAERIQRGLQATLDQETEALRVLTAEWDYLNRPDRLEELARTYLNMEPMAVETAVTSVKDIPMIEDQVTEPQFVSNNGGEAKNEAPMPAVQNESVSPTLQDAVKPSESDFQDVLDESTGGVQ